MKKSIVKTNLMIAVFCFSMSIGLPGPAMAGQVIDRGTTMDDGKVTVSRTGKDPEPCSLMGNYYKTHPMTVDELTRKWGTPVSSYDYSNGIKKLVFGPKDVEIGYTYFLIKDGMVVDYNITSEK